MTDVYRRWRVALFVVWAVLGVLTCLAGGLLLYGGTGF
jgi:hypothetical protein